MWEAKIFRGWRKVSSEAAACLAFWGYPVRLVSKQELLFEELS